MKISAITQCDQVICSLVFRQNTEAMKITFFLFFLSLIFFQTKKDLGRGLGSKPNCTILLCPWERHFTALSSACWSQQAAVNFSLISIKIKNFKQTAISWKLWKQVRVSACPKYRASVACL